MPHGKFAHYHITSYYSLENYLYHPDNIEEFKGTGFDKASHIKEITEQKKSKQISIVADVKKARDSYEEFKVDIAKDADISAIAEDLL